MMGWGSEEAGGIPNSHHFPNITPSLCVPPLHSLPLQPCEAAAGDGCRADGRFVSGHCWAKSERGSQPQSPSHRGSVLPVLQPDCHCL